MCLIAAADVQAWEIPFLVVALIASVILRFMLDGSGFGSGLLGGWLFQGGDGFGDPRRWKPSPRPAVKKYQPADAAQADGITGQAPRQLLNEGTGEITAQDLDQDFAGAVSVAQLAPGRRLSPAEELELARERRHRLRQRLPEIARDLHAQWEALGESMLWLEAASRAAPGAWDSPPRYAAAPQDRSRATSDVDALARRQMEQAAGTVRVSTEDLARHDQVDRNHNGIPDHLEDGRGRGWYPLEYSERAWREVLEAEQGPGILITGLAREIAELAAAQALMGYPLRLQGPLEETRAMLLRAYAACDERIPPQERAELREQVLGFLRLELPRMRRNLASAAEVMAQE